MTVLKHKSIAKGLGGVSVLIAIVVMAVHLVPTVRQSERQAAGHSGTSPLETKVGQPQNPADWNELAFDQIASYPEVTLVAYQQDGYYRQPGHQPTGYGGNPNWDSRSGQPAMPRTALGIGPDTSGFDGGAQVGPTRPSLPSFSAPVPSGGMRPTRSNRVVPRYQPVAPVNYQYDDGYSQPMQPYMMQEMAAMNHADSCGCQACQDMGPRSKSIMAVDGYRRNPNREPRWADAELLPWESLAYGEYIGPVRSPHIPEYRVRVGDVVDFTFRQTRDLSRQAYRLGIGDVVSISSQSYDKLFNDDNLIVLRDGTIQVRGIGSVLAANKTLERLQEELNDLGREVGPAKQNPEIIVKVVKPETELNDLIRTVDATNGTGGQFRTLTVSPDGTVQLPALGSVPAIGLTLDELGAEANARYAMLVEGLEVTPALRQMAPAFAYVLGEANSPGRYQLDGGPVSVMQMVAQAGGWRTGANLREIVIFRRDENWRLLATKLDLSKPMWGNGPHPSDDLWIRNNDIILLPKTPAQRVVDFIDIYFTRGLYGVFPSQGFSVNFDGISTL